MNLRDIPFALRALRNTDLSGVAIARNEWLEIRLSKHYAHLSLMNKSASPSIPVALTHMAELLELGNFQVYSLVSENPWRLITTLSPSHGPEPQYEGVEGRNEPPGG